MIRIVARKVKFGWWTVQRRSNLTLRGAPIRPIKELFLWKTNWLQHAFVGNKNKITFQP